MVVTGQAARCVSFYITAALLALVSVKIHCSGAARYCEPITQPICITSSVIHHFTKTPITVPTSVGPDDDDDDQYSNVYQTQREAVAAIHKYQPLLDRARGCREYLKPLLCSIYLPSCTGLGELLSPPCRDLCERARSRCSRSMRYLGLAWTAPLSCQQFPTVEENSSCISALRFGEVINSSADPAPVVSVTCFYDLSPSVPLKWVMPDGTQVSEDPMQPIHVEKIGKDAMTLTIKEFIDSQHGGNYTCTTTDQEFGRAIHLDNIFEPVVGPSCETISIPYCRHQLTYTRTSLSKSVFHSSQSDVEDFIKEDLQPGNCSPYMQSLLCSYLLPKCDDNEVFHNVLPCKEVCEKVFSDCKHLVAVGKVTGLPGPCDTLVYSGQSQECYNGIEFGQANFPDGWTFGSITMELECRTKPSSLEAANITLPSGASYGLNHPPVVDGDYRLAVRHIDDHTFKLVVHQFSVISDSGTYTCNDGAFSQSLMVRDVPTTCVPITIPQCIGHLSYTMIQVPNLYGTRNQKQMEQQMEQFGALIQSECSNFTSTMLCTPFVTRCGTRSDAPQVIMCRNLCDRVKSDCQPILDSEGMDQFSCEMFPYQKDKACYNGLEIGPVQVSDTSKGRHVQVECRHPAMRQTDWVLPGEPSDRIKMSIQDSYTSLLIIDGFQDDNSGVYTCTDGTFSQTVNITDKIVLQGGSQTMKLTTKTQSSTDSKVVVTLECASLLPSPVQSQSWVLPNELELLEGRRVNNVRASMMSGGIAHLVIIDFQPRDAGDYSCHVDGQSISTTVEYDGTPPSADMTTTCEEIKDENCRHHLGYDLTWRPNVYPLRSKIDGLSVLSSFFDVAMDKLCSPYLQTLVCVHKFPECTEGVVDESQLPCRELCGKVEMDCSDALAELNLQLSCDRLPSQLDGNCYNGVFISPVEYQTKLLGLITVEVNCTFLPVNKSATWRTPDGSLIIEGQTASSLQISTTSVDIETTQLAISRFVAAIHEGEYACVVDGLETSVSISDDELPKGSCQKIDQGFCSEGVGYSHAYFPNFLGHMTVAEAMDVFQLFSSVDPNVLLCSPYTRPLLCTLYFLPCDPHAETPTPLHIVPCRELCLKNLHACQQESQYGVEDCIDTDIGPLPCYNVDEVTIGNQVSFGGPLSVFVDCTYNLLPEYQPRWLLPNGQPLESSDPASHLRVVQLSPTVTRLYIDDYLADGGTYTCSGLNSAVIITIGEDGASM